MRNFKPYFSRTLKHHTDTNGHVTHFAAHSHHPWPDVSLKGHTDAWEDAALNLDNKWGKVFSEVIPSVQQHIAARLGLTEADAPNIAFAPNTHNFVLRLLSCLPDKPTVISTDSEFHSFHRQMTRLAEDRDATWIQVPAEPLATLDERLKETVQTTKADMVFFSQTLFNSGHIITNIPDIIHAIPHKETLAVIDGYHSFMAIETDFKNVHKRAFFLSGGYKYAMSGEGVCFMYCPDGYAMRPKNTGWYASFGSLQKSQTADETPYAEGGMRFMGATFDPSGLYRMRAVMDFLKAEHITQAEVRAHTQHLQTLFTEEINHQKIHLGTQLSPVGEQTGQFLTFSSPKSKTLHDALQAQGIITDVRADRLRFGFGIYQDESDVKNLVQKIKALKY